MARGQGLTEFIVVVLLVAIVVLAAVRLFGRTVRCEFSDTAGRLDSGADTFGDCPGDSDLPEDDPFAPPFAPPPNPNPPPTVPPSPPPPPPTPLPTPTPTPEIRIFNNPTLGGAPLDHCLNFGRNCDAPAALNFCRLQGFSSAIGFSLSAPVPRTYVPSDGVYCQIFPPVCTPFSSITCQR